MGTFTLKTEAHGLWLLKEEYKEEFPLVTPITPAMCTAVLCGKNKDPAQLVTKPEPILEEVLYQGQFL